MPWYLIDSEHLEMIDRVRKRLYTEDRMDGDTMRDAAHSLTAVADYAREMELSDEQERRLSGDVLMEKKPFHPGRLLATPGALRALEASGDSAAGFLTKHVNGDWGDVPPEDAKANENALRDGARLMSVYQTGGVKIWVITEADRSATTILIPEEY